MLEVKAQPAPYAELLQYAIWSVGGMLFWIVLSLIPAVRENQIFFAWMNVVMLFLELPGVLMLIGMCCFGVKAKYGASSICLTGALLISEVLNLVPFNPFALGLPFGLLCQCANFSGQGKYKASELCARRLLHFWGPGKDVHTQWQLAAQNCLAMALQGQGRYPEATKVVESMFKIAESNDARDQFQALALTDFAGNLSKLGRAKEAIEIATKAMDIWHGISDMPEDQLALMGMTMSQLGIAHECNGEYQVALEWYRKALAAKIETYGEESLEAATGFNNVGYILTECGQLDEASEKLEKSRAILTKLELQNTSSWAHVIENLGDLHRAKGNLDEAEKELMESLNLRKKRFKEDLHHTYHDLGKLYRDKKDWQSAQMYFEKALSIREKRFTASTVQTLQEFAKLMEAMERNSEASMLQKRAEELLANAG